MMPHDDKRRAEIELSWEITLSHLSRARTLLPQGAALTPACRVALTEYEVYIYHNELELALDVLEFLGERLHPDRAFWIDLEQAASNMKLSDRAVQLRLRSAS